MPNDPIGESLNLLLSFFLGDATIEETLDQVVGFALSAIPTTEMAGITMMVDDRLATPYYSKPEVAEIDVSQFEVGDGPCIRAYREATPIRISSIADDPRWPHFTETAERHGLHSTMSLPMTSGHVSLGAFNFYSRQVDGFSEAAEAKAIGFASQAAIVLANSKGYWDKGELDEGLQQAIRRRAVIEQAKGILMARSKVGPDKAFELLVEASQKSNRKLRDIAAELVDSITG